MTDILEHPPPATAPAAPAARAMAATGPGRVVIPLPMTVCFARMFAAAFEFPFQRHRGWIPLRQAMSARLHRWRRDAGD